MAKNTTSWQHTSDGHWTQGGLQRKDGGQEEAGHALEGGPIGQIALKQ